MAPKVAQTRPFGYLRRMIPSPANEPAGQSDDTVDFGFSQVRREDKAPLVRGIFERVAGRYDLMNDLMSGGIHRLWKAAMIDWLAPRAHWRMVDVAGGTGDIAFGILGAVGGPARLCAKAGSLTIADINQAMLEVGRRRAIKGGAGEAVDFVAADAEKLPIASSSLDAYTAAFGLRNVTDLDAALAEARRVLKPGGRFLCLEFSKPALPLLGPLYDNYSFTVLPWLGRWVAGDADAYRYLAESIRRFPDQSAFARRIGQAGFDQVKVRNLSGGIAALHSAWRL
jgi:demethylmenaquinone methyltransferase/2-methoxy-6-polyprenyl-1,4-benzoquinol methylase